MGLGVGFSEILVILVLILVFFGSKELPKFIRDAARMVANLRRYSEKVRRELDTMTSTVTEALPAANQPGRDIPQPKSTKQLLREKFSAARKNLAPAEKSAKSEQIRRHLLDSPQMKAAGAVMIYINIGAEVETRETIREMLLQGKRVVVPYCKKGASTMGIGEITDLDKDVVIGETRSPEPLPELRDQFYRSDLHLIICPGVGFDHFGGRLGRGRAYYDNFLRELKGRVPIIGLAFDCQIQDNRLPFSYTDVAMDQVITESGFLVNRDEDGNIVTPATITSSPEIPSG
jgi:5-formyltetrahydrofolate cyclo-ligase